MAARWVASAPTDLKLQVYVGDPLSVLRGSDAEQQRLAAVVIVMWTIMGFPIASHKAVMAKSLVWTGVGFTISSGLVVAEVPESKVKELDQLLEQSVQNNVVRKRCLRTLIGKCMAIASVLFVWRPFICELYVALHSEESGQSRYCTPFAGCEPSWLERWQGIRREYSLGAYRGLGPRVVMTWDASPYGMGGTLQVDRKYVEFFAIAISADDEHFLGTKSGSHEGQQT